MYKRVSIDWDWNSVVALFVEDEFPSREVSICTWELGNYAPSVSQWSWNLQPESSKETGDPPSVSLSCPTVAMTAFGWYWGLPRNGNMFSGHPEIFGWPYQPQFFGSEEPWNQTISYWIGELYHVLYPPDHMICAMISPGLLFVYPIPWTTAPRCSSLGQEVTQYVAPWLRRHFSMGLQWWFPWMGVPLVIIHF